MKMSVKEIAVALPEKGMDKIITELATHAKQSNNRVVQLCETRERIRSKLARAASALAVATAEGDHEAIGDGLRELNTLAEEHHAVQNSIYEQSNNTEDFQRTIAPVLNAAAALAPLAVILKQHWHDLPPETKNMIYRKTENTIAW